MEHIFLGLLIGLGIYLASVILAFFVVIFAVIVVGLEVFFEYLGKIFGGKKEMNKIIKRLEIWRKVRGLDKSQGFEFDLNNQVSFLTEEITEYLRAKNDNDKIDALCDLSVFSLNAINGIDNNYSDIFSSTYCMQPKNYHIANIIDRIPYIFKCNMNGKYSFIDIIEMCKYMIDNMDYDYFKCMNETLKEIESRKGAFNSESGKWEKFKDEEIQKLWYKADYKSCKL